MEYILNIELKKGVIKKLTVYKGINVAEVAYNFCKENDLDFSSLNNLVLQIEEILEKLEGKGPSKDKRIIDNNKSTNNKVKYLNPSLSNRKLFPYELSIDNYSNYFSESKEPSALYSCRSVKNSQKTKISKEKGEVFERLFKEAKKKKFSQSNLFKKSTRFIKDNTIKPTSLLVKSEREGRNGVKTKNNLIHSFSDEILLFNMKKKNKRKSDLETKHLEQLHQSLFTNIFISLLPINTKTYILSNATIKFEKLPLNIYNYIRPVFEGSFSYSLTDFISEMEKIFKSLTMTQKREINSFYCKKTNNKINSSKISNKTSIPSYRNNKGNFILSNYIKLRNNSISSKSKNLTISSTKNKTNHTYNN